MHSTKSYFFSQSKFKIDLSTTLAIFAFLSSAEASGLISTAVNAASGSSVFNACRLMPIFEPNSKIFLGRCGRTRNISVQTDNDLDNISGEILFLSLYFVPKSPFQKSSCIVFVSANAYSFGIVCNRSQGITADRIRSPGNTVPGKDKNQSRQRSKDACRVVNKQSCAHFSSFLSKST